MTAMIVQVGSSLPHQARVVARNVALANIRVIQAKPTVFHVLLESIKTSLEKAIAFSVLQILTMLNQIKLCVSAALLAKHQRRAPRFVLLVMLGSTCTTVCASPALQVGPASMASQSAPSARKGHTPTKMKTRQHARCARRENTEAPDWLLLSGSQRRLHV